MFAYCLNDPVNCYDSIGTRPKWIDDLINKAKEIVEELREQLSEKKEREDRGTIVVGADYLMGFGAGTSGNIGLGIDRNGNIGVIFGMYYGAAMPGVSITGFLSVSNAKGLNGLKGKSLSVGGSAGEGAVFGGEVTIMPIPGEPTPAIAGTLQMGIGGGIPVETHAQYGETHVISFNLFDILIKGCEYVLR